MRVKTREGNGTRDEDGRRGEVGKDRGDEHTTPVFSLTRNCSKAVKYEENALSEASRACS